MHVVGYMWMCAVNEGGVCVCVCCGPQISSATVDLMLNWGPITYIVVIIPVMIYSKRPNSARPLIVLGATLCAVGTVVRLVPVWVKMSHTLTLALVHAGQILDAAVGPIVMSLPPKVSSTWFAENERYAGLVGRHGEVGAGALGHKQCESWSVTATLPVHTAAPRRRRSASLPTTWGRQSGFSPRFLSQLHMKSLEFCTSPSPLSLVVVVVPSVVVVVVEVEVEVKRSVP